MKRREFIKSAVTIVAGLSMPSVLSPYFSDSEAFEKGDLVVVHGSSPSRITRAAIDAFGGMKRFISKGDIVVIKPNMAWDRTPEQAANTNP